MNNRHFRPRPLLYILAAPCLALLCGLGAWQLQRLAWKQALLASQQALSVIAPIETDRSHPLFGLEDHYPVILTGTLDLSRSIGFFGQSLNGKSGEDVYAPLTLSDGQIVWVKLGLVEGRYDAATATATAASAVAFGTLPRGQIYAGGWRGNPAFNPGNQPERDMWAVADPEAMSDHVELDPFFALPMLVELTETLGERSPFTPTPTNTALRNPHLSYAVQWFSFALILLLFVVILSFPKRGGDEQ